MFNFFELIEKKKKLYISIILVMFFVASIVIVVIPDRYGSHVLYIGFFSLFFSLVNGLFGITISILTIVIYFISEILNNTLELSKRVATAGIVGLIFNLSMVILIHSLKTLYFKNKETLSIVERSKARYQRIVDNIKEGMLIISQDGILIFLNWSASNILGISVTDVHKDIKEIFGEDTVLIVGTDFTKRDKLTSESTITYNHPVRGERKLYVSTLPYSEQYEGVPSFVAFIQDTTDLDETKIKNELLLKKNHLLLREIDHRIGNYLSIINAYLRLYILDNEISKQEGLQKIGEVIQLSSRISTRYFNNFEQQTLRLDTLIEEINNDISSIYTNEHIQTKLELLPIEMHVDFIMPVSLLCTIFLFNTYERIKNHKEKIDVLIRMEGKALIERICIVVDQPRFFSRLKYGSTKKIEIEIVEALLKQVNGSITVNKPYSKCLEFEMNMDRRMKDSC